MSAILITILSTLAVQAIPGLLHLLLSPDPKSWWGAVIDRGRKLGFDPAVFEPAANRLAKAAVVAVASGEKNAAAIPMPDGSTLSVQTIGRLS